MRRAIGSSHFGSSSWSLPTPSSLISMAFDGGDRLGTNRQLPPKLPKASRKRGSLRALPKTSAATPSQTARCSGNAPGRGSQTAGACGPVFEVTQQDQGDVKNRSGQQRQVQQTTEHALPIRARHVSHLLFFTCSHIYLDSDRHKGLLMLQQIDNTFQLQRVGHSTLVPVAFAGAEFEPRHWPGISDHEIRQLCDTQC